MINLGPKIKAPKGFVAMLVRNPKKAMQDWYLYRGKTSTHLHLLAVAKKVHRDFLNSLDVAGSTPLDEEWIIIFNKTKHGFTYKADSFDKWTIPDYTKPFEGDCEDFALACRHRAMAVNVYGGRLLLCKELKLNAVAHCVYLLGEWVLDCRLDKPCDLKTFKEMYTLYAVSSPALMGSWYRVAE